MGTPGFQGVPGWFPKCGLGTPRVSMAGSQQPSTFMAGSQSVVRGPLGGPTGFQRGPWLVPKVWFGDLSGSLRGFWGLGLGLQSPGTTDQGPPPLLSDFGASAWDCRVARDPLELRGPPGTTAKKLKNDQMIPPKGLLTGNSRGPRLLVLRNDAPGHAPSGGPPATAAQIKCCNSI